MIRKNKQNRKNKKATKVYAGVGRVSMIIEILHYPIKFNLSDSDKDFLANIKKFKVISDKQLWKFEQILSRVYTFERLGRDYIIKIKK